MLGGKKSCQLKRWCVEVTKCLILQSEGNVFVTVIFLIGSNHACRYDITVAFLMKRPFSRSQILLLLKR